MLKRLYWMYQKRSYELFIRPKNAVDAVKGTVQNAMRALAALPTWVRFVIAAQSLFPAIVLFVQIRYLVVASQTLHKALEFLPLARTLPAEQRKQIVEVLIPIRTVEEFDTLFLLNLVFGIFGLAILVFLMCNSRPKNLLSN